MTLRHFHRGILEHWDENEQECHTPSKRKPPENSLIGEPEITTDVTQLVMRDAVDEQLEEIESSACDHARVNCNAKRGQVFVCSPHHLLTAKKNMLAMVGQALLGRPKFCAMIEVEFATMVDAKTNSIWCSHVFEMGRTSYADPKIVIYCP